MKLSYNCLWVYTTRETNFSVDHRVLSSWFRFRILKLQCIEIWNIIVSRMYFLYVCSDVYHSLAPHL
jgi:hypothetical protein